MVTENELQPRSWSTQVKEVVVGGVNWEWVALMAIGVLAAANLMIYLRRK